MKEHMKEAYELCLQETSADPIAILNKLMDLPFCRMHGPEHHVLVGAVLLTAYRNAGVELSVPDALAELYKRASAVPGAACGYWGACGAGISTGQYLSIVTGSNPLVGEVWGKCMAMTFNALSCMAEVGGPRCCKRDSYLSVLAAVDHTAQQLGIQMEKTVPICSRSSQSFSASVPVAPSMEEMHEKSRLHLCP